MSATIMVTGATGGLGGGVLDALVDLVPADRVAALARDPARAAGLLERGIDVRPGDYHDPDGLVAALQGVQTLLLVSAPAFTDAVTAHRHLIEAAARAGVGHVLYTAIQHAPGSRFAIDQVTAWDEATVDLLHEAEPASTVVRNTLYLDAVDALIGEPGADGVVRLPAGHTPAALATRRDIAEATAHLLVEDAPPSEITLAGSTPVTLADVVATLAEVLGRPLTYEPVEVDEYVAERVAAGTPEAVARFSADWFAAVRAGEFAAPGDIERLLGRPPTAPRAYLAEARAQQPPGAGRGEHRATAAGDGVALP